MAMQDKQTKMNFLTIALVIDTAKVGWWYTQSL